MATHTAPCASTPRTFPTTSQLPFVTNLGVLLEAGEKSAMCRKPSVLFTRSRYAGAERPRTDVREEGRGVIDWRCWSRMSSSRKERGKK